LEFNKLTHKAEIAKEEQIQALKDASAFDFVGGGATNIAKDDLTGSRIDLQLLCEAVEEGIKQYPIAGCDDIHQYIEKMSRNTITKVLLMIQNLGIENNPHSRGFSLRRRKRNESKDSLIVRVVEAFTPKFLALPVSIQNLKDEIERKRIEKIAEVAAEEREKENEKLVTVPEDRRPKLSNKRRTFVREFEHVFSPNKKRRTATDTAFTPMKLCSSSAPNSSSWEMSDFDDSDLNPTEVFSMKNNA
jgi:hypothetical protein